jgi:hypothetical protein
VIDTAELSGMRAFDTLRGPQNSDTKTGKNKV